MVYLFTYLLVYLFTCLLVYLFTCLPDVGLGLDVGFGLDGSLHLMVDLMT